MRKSVVILSAFATPYRSGAEACSEEVAAHLQDRFAITIVAARMRRDLPHLDHLESGVPVWRVGIGLSIDKWLYPFLAPFAVRALKPDIVHAVLESYAGLAMSFCRWLYPSAKRILTCQSTNTSMLVGFMHRSANHVTAISNVLVERAKRFGVQATLIPNGIRLAEIQQACKQHQKVNDRILFVGRLENMKGIDTLLTSFALMQRSTFNIQHSSLHLRIVGDGSERKHLETLTENLCIADRVTFVGRVSPELVAVEFAQAPIFCGLSRSEALGNVFLEAQAAGCAVVGTNVGGIPDIVKNDVTGILVPPDDVDAAASALTRLLEDSALREKLASAGQKNAANYDWKEIAELYGEVYLTFHN